MSTISNLQLAGPGLLDAPLLPLERRDREAVQARRMDVAWPLAALTEGHSRAPNAEWAKPAAAVETVSQRAAAKALERVVQHLASAGVDAAQPRVGIQTLREVEVSSMETLMLMATQVSVQALGDLAKAKGKAMQILSHEQDVANQKEIRDAQEAAKKAAEQQHKAKKAGIFGAVCDWVVGAVEAVSGVVKVATGVLTGNPMMVAGGTMELLAGTAGLVKAVTDTLALVDPKHAAEYEKIGEDAAKVQLACEVIGAAIDITSALEDAALKAVPKAAGKVLEEGSEHAGQFVKAVGAGTREAVQEAAENITKEIMKEVMTDVGEKEAFKLLSEGEVSKIVREAIEQAGMKAIKKGAKEGVEEAAKDASQDIVKNVRRRLLKATVSAAMDTSVQLARRVSSGAQQIDNAVIDAERARLQRQIDDLVAEQAFLDALFQMYKDMKKRTEESVKQLISGQATAQSAGSKAMLEGEKVQVRGAASMAGVAATTV